MTAWKTRVGATLPRAAIVAHDLFMVWLCWVALNQFRWSMEIVSLDLPFWSPEVLLILFAQGLVFWKVGLYRGVWRFASLPDLLNILKASLAGLLAIVLALFLYNRLELVPRSVLALYPIVLTALLGMPRLLYRSWKDHGLARTDKAAIRVLILGAGQAGETLARDPPRPGAHPPAGPAQHPHGEPCRPACHRARAVPLQPPRTGAALGAGAVSDRVDGAAGHAAAALSQLEGPRPGAHRQGRDPRADPGRRAGRRDAGARPAPRRCLPAGRLPRRRRQAARKLPAGPAGARPDRGRRQDRSRGRGQADRDRDAVDRCRGHAARGRGLRAHRPAVPHRPAARRPARRPFAAGRTEGSRDRGPARAAADNAGLEVDPRLAGWPQRPGHRRRRVDRPGAVPAVRQARRAPDRAAGDRRAGADHGRGGAAPRLPADPVRAGPGRLRRSGRGPVCPGAGQARRRVPRSRLQARAGARNPAARSDPQQRPRHREI